MPSLVKIEMHGGILSYLSKSCRVTECGNNSVTKRAGSPLIFANAFAFRPGRCNGGRAGGQFDRQSHILLYMHGFLLVGQGLVRRIGGTGWGSPA